MEERIVAADPVADPQGYRRELLALLANLALIRATPPARWERVGIHQERGETSFRVLTQEIAGHARAHLLQLDQTVAAVRR
jgi:hypothetical protein